MFPHLMGSAHCVLFKCTTLRQTLTGMGMKRRRGKEEEKTVSFSFCMQGISPLPYYHIRESGPISAFITQHFPPPRICNSAILICFGDTQQSDSLSERKFVLLENI